jgi:hypothetical protein
VQKHAQRPFVLIGVNENGYTTAELKAAIAAEGLTWRSIVDTGAARKGPSATRWRATNTPTFYAIDHKGVIRRKWVGSPSEAALDALIETLIREAEADAKK